MAKPSGNKKRRHSNTQNVDFLCNITGLASSSQGDDSMEACLAEMEGAQEQAPSAKRPATETRRSVNTQRSARSNAWKNDFEQWVTTGTYAAGLPNPQTEVSRHFHTLQLSSFLLNKCPLLRMPAFERWWIDSKWEDYPSLQKNDDPVIPCRPSLESDTSQRLVEELMHSDNDMTLEQAQEIVRELCLKTKQALQEVSTMASRHLAPFSKGCYIHVEKGASQYTIKYKRKSWKKPFSVQVNISHYDKLWNAFVQAHPFLKHKKRVLPVFHVLVFCLLLRYSSLSGGQLLNDLRGGGMQGAVMPDAFDVLERFFSSQEIVECFASPWNAHLPTFASTFEDLDAHFGSVGDFRRMDLAEGVYEANPPFSPGLMMQMVKQMDECLSAANLESRRLTFFVIVPTADSSDDCAVPPAKQHAQISFSAMINSPYCRMHFILPSRQHGYVEGAQHLRPTRFKESPYDTSLILLQSDAANQEFASNHKAFEKKMRKAFASRHEEEIQKRQQKGSK